MDISALKEEFKESHKNVKTGKEEENTKNGIKNDQKTIQMGGKTIPSIIFGTQKP